MNSFLFFLAVIFLISAIIYFIFFFESMFVGHDLSTNKQTQKIIEDILKKHNLTEKKFYDLGCCRGTFALRLQKTFPKMQITGIDSSFLRILMAKLLNGWQKSNINFIKNDIFKINISEADVVYTWLWYSLLPKLENKFQKELKPGTIIICNESYLPELRPIETYKLGNDPARFEKVYVYKIPNN
ncbi:MAG: class I SAM-dependent methyltransferase [Patescibacteria group bacterium]